MIETTTAATGSNRATGDRGSVRGAKALTPRQLQILRWLDENPSSRAGWTVNGREPRAKDGPEKWNKMLIAGENGSILIDAADNEALHNYIVGCPTPDKIYGPNELGKAALATSTAERSPVVSEPSNKR